ncbi:hypothetical protein Tco_0973662 [Tanacetum coccineum]
MKMEILLEPTSNKLMVENAEFDESNANVLERFYTSAGNPVNEILLKLNLPDHRKLKDGGEVKEFQRSFRHSDTERLSRSDEVLKLKNFKKDATLKLFKSTNQESDEITVDDLKMLKITFYHTNQDKGTSSSLKSNITTSYSQDKKKKEVCEHKNEDLHSMIVFVEAVKHQVAMSPPIRRKYHDSVAFATGCRRIKNCKRCNRKVIETKIIAKDGTVTRVPGQFQGYEMSKEEPMEQSRRHDLYGFVDHPQLQ